MTSNLPAAATRAAELDREEVLATFFQGLADPTRVRILELLAERPRTVTELQAALGLAQGQPVTQERVESLGQIGRAHV